MTELLRQWIMHMLSIALITACAMALTPGGKVKKMVKVICGIATVLAMLSPVSSDALSDLEDSFSALREEAISVSAELSEINEEIKESIIISELEAYISDKGSSLGIKYISSDIVLKTFEDGTKRPYSITLDTDANDEQFSAIGKIITDDLGIPKERIYRKGE